MDNPQANPRLLDLVLLALFRTALTVATTVRRGNSKMLGGLGHFHIEQFRCAKVYRFDRARRTVAKRLDNAGRYCTRKRRRDSITDLSRTVPLRGVKPEPIWKAVKPRHLPHGDAARVRVVDRARTGECAARPVGTRA